MITTIVSIDEKPDAWFEAEKMCRKQPCLITWPSDFPADLAVAYYRAHPETAWDRGDRDDKLTVKFYNSEIVKEIVYGDYTTARRK